MKEKIIGVEATKQDNDNLIQEYVSVDFIVNGNDVYIVDFKSNKEIKKSSFYDKKKKSNVMMKFPVSNLQDCNFNHYQLQLSTYAFMLQTLRPELNIKKLILYHIDHDGNEMLYECQYLKEEVIRMLNHYKKKIKIILVSTKGTLTMQETIIEKVVFERPMLSLGDIFNYDEELNKYYFYSVERYEGNV